MQDRTFGCLLQKESCFEKKKLETRIHFRIYNIFIHGHKPAKSQGEMIQGVSCYKYAYNMLIFSLYIHLFNPKKKKITQMTVIDKL